MKKTRRRYTKELKKEVVRFITEQGCSYAEAGRNFGDEAGISFKFDRIGRTAVCRITVRPKKLTTESRSTRIQNGQDFIATD